MPRPVSNKSDPMELGGLSHVHILRYLGSSEMRMDECKGHSLAPTRHGGEGREKVVGDQEW